jgi:4-hydroxy-4-methyl-2-oxoglutarate aldolase
MPIQLHAPPASILPPAALEAWRDIPVSIVGDELNRSQIVQSALRPLVPGVRLLGTALTVECMVGDNSALHYALERVWPGAVIVADARGHVETAVWGEIMHTCALAQGAAGLVLDGAVRDSAAIAASGLPAYVRGISPRGPHKGWGGSILGPVHCGGVAVHPGDLMLGDEDGVIAIRPEQLDGLLERCRRRLDKETGVLERVRAGEPTVKVFGFPAIERIGR